MEDNKERFGQKLKLACQAEILRSHQRDNDFVNGLREKLLDILHNFEHRNLLSVYSNIPASLIYFTFTTAMGNQTLGEEYTGIVEANLDDHKVPSLIARILSAALERLGEKALTIVLRKLRMSIKYQHDELLPATVSVPNILLNLQNRIPLLILMHKGLFYIYGRYYSIGKRITGIDYVKVYGNYPMSSISWGLKLLGIATFLQCMIKLCQNEYTLEEAEKHPGIADENKVVTLCQLCFEVIPTTATSCGHLFCWTCLCNWLCVKSQCPLCREYCTLSRVTHLMNL